MQRRHAGDNQHNVEATCKQQLATHCVQHATQLQLHRYTWLLVALVMRTPIAAVIQAQLSHDSHRFTSVPAGVMCHVACTAGPQARRLLCGAAHVNMLEAMLSHPSMWQTDMRVAYCRVCCRMLALAGCM
jgi:hypothetical protein